MPVKKTTKPTRTKISDEAVHVRHEHKKDHPMGMSFIVFLLFISLAIISFALYRVYNEQTRLLGVINSLTNEIGEQQVVIIPDDKEENAIQYADSEIQGLRLAYTACPPTFTGACDDLMIYSLNQNGSKEVLIPSVRSLSGAPRTNELLQPLAANSDNSRLAFGAWAYGGKRNTGDKRVWIVETATGKILLQSNSVPLDAVYSPDMTSAAYYSVDENGEERVMVIDLEADKEYLAARATNGITYKDANSKATINWLDNNKIAIIQYEAAADGGEPTIVGEREITIN